MLSRALTELMSEQINQIMSNLSYVGKFSAHCHNAATYFKIQVIVLFPLVET
jgi:hypothetical protein